MAPTTVNYEDVEPAAPGMHVLRDALGTEHLGVTVLDADPGSTGLEHDHAEDDHEEVYLLLEGGATVTVDGEAVELDPGDAVYLPAEATREIEGGDEPSTLVLAGAP